MKKILTLLLSIFLLAGFMSCDLASDDDETTTSDATAYTYQVDWDAYLTWGTFNASLKDASDVVIVEGQGGSEPDAVAGNDASTESFFGDTGSSYNFVHDGSDSYGGVMTSFDDGADLSAMTEIKFAVYGGFPETLGTIGLQLGDASGNQEKNIFDYTSETSGDWVVYTIQLTEYDTVNFATFNWIGLWNPKTAEYSLTDEEGYTACDFIYDIAFN